MCNFYKDLKKQVLIHYSSVTQSLLEQHLCDKIIGYRQRLM